MEPTKISSVEILDAVSAKKGFNFDSQLSDFLGIHLQTIRSYRKNKQLLTAKQVVNILLKAKAQQQKKLVVIKPIIEYYPIIKTPTKRNARMQILDPSVPRQSELIDDLKKKNGVYIFYDSQGKAVYIGKANQLSLWTEIINAYNRDRETYMYMVRHKQTGDTLGKTNRRLQRHKTYFRDIAYYFSAYEIEKGHINTIEALMIRSFSNDIFNVKMESV